MSTNSEDYFSIIKLCLPENAEVTPESQNLPAAGNNKEPETTPKAKVKESGLGESGLGNWDEESAYSEVTDEEFYAQIKNIANLTKPSVRICEELNVAGKTNGNAPAASGSDGGMEAISADVQKIKMFLDELELKNTQNPQPWKGDIERMEQQHKHESQDWQRRLAALRAENEKLTRDVNLKMEQLKVCDDWRQREHADLMQIIDAKSKQIENLEREQLNVKTCLKAFEGLYKNLYDDINKLKTTQYPSNEIDHAQMREETVKLVRQEVIKRMDGFLDVAFQNLRSMTPANDTAMAATALQPPPPPQPPICFDVNGHALMSRPIPANNASNALPHPIPTNNASNALPSLLEIQTSPPRTMHPNAKNKPFTKYNAKQANKKPWEARIPQQANDNKMGTTMPQSNANLVELADPRGVGHNMQHANIAADPRHVQPYSNINNIIESYDPRFILQLLQSNQNASNNGLLGNPPPIQSNASNVAPHVGITEIQANRQQYAAKPSQPSDLNTNWRKRI